MIREFTTGNSGEAEAQPGLGSQDISIQISNPVESAEIISRGIGEALKVHSA